MVEVKIVPNTFTQKQSFQLRGFSSFLVLWRKQHILWIMPKTEHTKLNFKITKIYIYKNLWDYNFSYDFNS